MLPTMQSPTGNPIPAEIVSQAGAGGLLSAVGVVELALGFGATGWSHRAGAVVVALIGAVLLVRGIATIVAALDRPRPAPGKQPRDAVGTTPAVPHSR
jgi:uncharacterized membrane protein HdeD (DUF308 family)